MVRRADIAAAETPSSRAISKPTISGGQAATAATRSTSRSSSSRIMSPVSPPSSSTASLTTFVSTSSRSSEAATCWAVAFSLATCAALRRSRSIRADRASARATGRARQVNPARSAASTAAATRAMSPSPASAEIASRLRSAHSKVIPHRVRACWATRRSGPDSPGCKAVVARTVTRLAGETRAASPSAAPVSSRMAWRARSSADISLSPGRAAEPRLKSSVNRAPPAPKGGRSSHRINVMIHQTELLGCTSRQRSERLAPGGDRRLAVLRHRLRCPLPITLGECSNDGLMLTLGRRSGRRFELEQRHAPAFAPQMLPAIGDELAQQRRSWSLDRLVQAPVRLGVGEPAPAREFPVSLEGRLDDLNRCRRVQGNRLLDSQDLQPHPDADELADGLTGDLRDHRPAMRLRVHQAIALKQLDRVTDRLDAEAEPVGGVPQ